MKAKIPIEKLDPESVKAPTESGEPPRNLGSPARNANITPEVPLKPSFDTLSCPDPGKEKPNIVEE